jgi:hypothetical protein
VTTSTLEFHSVDSSQSASGGGGTGTAFGFFTVSPATLPLLGGSAAATRPALDVHSADASQDGEFQSLVQLDLMPLGIPLG